MADELHIGVGWTLETLRVHVEARIDELEASASRRFGAQATAVDAAFQAEKELVETLRDRIFSEMRDRDLFLERLATERAKQVQAALAAADRALSKAETANDKRFDSVNEFRAQLADQAREFMPRKEVEVLLGALTDKLDGLGQLANVTSGRSAGLNQAWAYLLGIATLIGAFAGLVYAFRH